MTDLEFDILDELYFVISFDELVENSGHSEDDVVNVLKELYNRKWIRVLLTVEKDEDPKSIDLDRNYEKYLYLASKQGLFAHNSYE